MATLNDVQATEPRAITDGPFGSHLTSAHYTDARPRVVRLQNIGDGVFNDASAHISAEHFRSLKNHAVLPGDLLVASLGEALPRACLAPDWLGPAIVKADCIRIRLSRDVDNRWVLYAMQRPAVRKWAEEHRHGVGRPRLGLKVIRQIPLPIAPLDEQRRIVDILEDHLSRLDSGVKLLDAQRARLDAMMAAWSRDVRAAHPQTKLLGEVAEVISGPALQSKWFLKEPHGVRLLRGDNIEPGRLRWNRARTWPHDKIAGYEHLHIAAGDVILGMDRPVVSAGLKLAMVNEEDLPALLVQRVARIRSNRPRDAEYIRAMMDSPAFIAHITAHQTGTQLPHITLQSVREFTLTWPEGTARDGLVTQARFLHDSHARLEESLAGAARLTEQLRHALLSAAFSGR